MNPKGCQFELDFSNQDKGTYIIKILTDNGIVVKKVILE